MAHCKQTAVEFIQDCFSPMIAVLCSTDAELLCMKNNLTFVELIQPFCRMTSEAFMKDPLSNNNYPIKNLHLIIKDMNQLPPQPTLAKKILNESVYSSHLSDPERTNVTVTIKGNEISHPASTPWYEAYRSTFLQVAYPSDHEFIKTFIACILVVSSNNADALEQFAKLTQQQNQQQHQSPSKLPKWFSPNIFKYYVLVHDFSCGNMSKAETIFQGMKYRYGAHACHLLQINSCSEMSPSISEDDLKTCDNQPNNIKPDPWSQFLSKKTAKYDSFDYTPQTPVEDSQNQMFPGHVTEGEEATDLELNTGVQVPNSVTDSQVIDHPLAAQNHVDQSVNIKRSKSYINSEASSPLDDDFNHSNGNLNKWSTNSDTQDSQKSNQSTHHGCCLSASDIDRLKIFVHEFCVRGFFPFAEKLMRTLNEQVSNRKGLHKSLFSATKKWFGGNRSAGQGTTVPNNSVVYGQEALELQIRRLGDVAFMFQNYEMAYQAFHTAKRDFNNDQAWFYYAGALEMSALAIFMQGSATQKPYPQHYLENAISTYNTCKAYEFATRAVMLSTECLKSRNSYAESAMQFIRMTSEDSDLRSALLLEQAAYCFLAITKPAAMLRKYAFHMILAGHRFCKAGQRKHSLRCYKQAYQVYDGKGWALAEDHINFTIGRQSFNLKDLHKACSVFQLLLSDCSKQSAAQQTAFLREFLFVYKELDSQSDIDGIEELCSLPIPKINAQHIKVRLSVMDVKEQEEKTTYASGTSFDDPESENKVWNKLESICLKQSSNSAISLHHLPCYTAKTLNSESPQTVINEGIVFQLTIQNILKIPIRLTDMFLLWEFSPKDKDKFSDVIGNSRQKNKMSLAEQIIYTEHIEELILEELVTHKVSLSLTPVELGDIRILGLSYNLGMMKNKSLNDSDLNLSQPIGNYITVAGQQTFIVQGPRLNASKKEKCGNFYGPDKRLEIKVLDSMPQLQIKFYGSPTSMLSGEVKQMVVEFTNIGPKALQEIWVSADHPGMFSFGAANVHMPLDYGVYKASPVPTPRKYSRKEKLSSMQPVFLDGDAKLDRVCRITLNTENEILEPNQTVGVPLWLLGPEKIGDYALKMLFMYHVVGNKSKFRSLRHKITFTVSNSIQLQAVATKSNLSYSSNQNGGNWLPNSNTLHISLDIKNSNEISDPNITEITIAQISAFSPKWSLVPLSCSNRQGLKVSCGEKALMTFKAAPFEMTDSEAAENVVAVSNIPLTDSEIDSSSSPCSDFYHRYRTNMDDLFKEDSLPPELLPDKKPPSKLSLDLNDINTAILVDLTLIVLWKAFVVDESGLNHLIMGQHHVTIDRIDTIYISKYFSKPLKEKEILMIKKDTQDSPEIDQLPSISDKFVKIQLKHPNQVDHNFAKNRVCVVPTTVVIQNCCDLILTAKLLTDTMRNLSITSHAFSDCSINNFTWVGCHNSSLEILPRKQKEISIFACFVNTGTYNLSTLQLKVKPTNLRSDLVIPNDCSGYILQQPPHASYIVIADS